MLTVDGRVKIVDFGLAKTPEVEAGARRRAFRDADGGRPDPGTVPYMSPEQARGSPG